MAKAENKQPEKTIDEWWNDERRSERVDEAELDGWWKPDVRVPLVGVLKSRFEVYDQEKDEKRPVLVAEVRSRIVGENNQEPVTLEPGKHIGIGYRHNIRELFNYQDGTEFRILPLEKRNIGKGRTLWSFELRVKAGSKKLEKPQAPPVNTRETEDNF